MIDTIRNFAVVMAVLCFCGTARAQVAVVNGESISLQDVENAAAQDLRNLELRKAQFDIQLEREKKAALEDALEKIVGDRLLAAEAMKRKVPVDQLLAIEAEAFVVRLKKEYAVKFYLEPPRTAIPTERRE